MSTYQAQLVYGLLRTEKYARALFSVDDPSRVEGSSYSGTNGGDCVEVADGCSASVPDSKNPAGPVLVDGLR
ncbi:DUF397 domain-containing protein [Kitasatospora cinereorecta]|uniref:DUF397 domain-containing protein n=1 Tax=Streptomyces sp. NPDC057429 TaxID=3346130 RepID=UPI003618E52C